MPALGKMPGCQGAEQPGRRALPPLAGLTSVGGQVQRSLRHENAHSIRAPRRSHQPGMECAGTTLPAFPFQE